VVSAYEAPFPTPESKAGAAQFPLLVPTSEDDPMAVHQREVVAKALGDWEKPALVAFSDEDPVFPYPKAGDRFVELIPSVDEQVRIEGAAHFLQEDRGEQIAAEILRFLAAP
jgi:haloalkane dehalogenase